MKFDGRASMHTQNDNDGIADSSRIEVSFSRVVGQWAIHDRFRHGDEINCVHVTGASTWQ